MPNSFLLAVVVGAAALSVPANPLAPAEEGMLQCYRPDVQSKTCQSIAGYERTGPASFDNIAVIPVAKDVTLETRTPVAIKGDAVCGFIKPEDMVGGVLRVRGRVIEPAKARPILERMAQGVASIASQEICTTYEQTGADVTARITVAGDRRPDQDTLVRWISASDGYTVAP